MIEDRDQPAAPLWVWVGALAWAVTTALVLVGEPNPARLTCAVVFLAAAALCVVRRRGQTVVASSWTSFAVGAVFLALGMCSKALVVAADVMDTPWSLLPTTCTVLAFPALYGGIVGWDRSRRLVRDTHAVSTGIGAVAVGVAGLELWAARGGPQSGLSAVERMTSEVPAAACWVLLVVATVASTGRGRQLEPHRWLVVGAVASITILMTARLLGVPTLAWAPAACATGAAALACSAALRPGRTPRRRPAVLATAATVGSYVLLAQAVVVLTLADPGREPVPVALALVAITTCALRLYRNLRDLVALADVRRQASTDELTGTANRRALLQRIDQVTGRGDQVCLAVLDIDDFSTINDGLGHANGDALLIAVARRVEAALRSTCVLGRVGGDDFAVVASAAGGHPPTDPVELGHRLCDALREPFDVAGLRLHLSASIGLATSTRDDGHLLFARAHAALRESKTHRSGPVVHDPGRHEDNGGTVQLVEELRSALHSEQMTLFLQPQFDVRTGRPVAAEALIRWQHPRRGLLGPAEFVPLAEKHGLIGALTEQVLDLAVEHLAAWRTQGVDLRLAVNLSASNLLDEALPGRILARLLAHDVPPCDLVLEITENVFVGDSPRVRDVLGRLAALGCELSIDDYGTGWSSLGYLRQLPVRELKLDRSFTVDLLSDHRAAAIVGSTIDLAHTLGLRVVAEGVEDGGTLQRLAGLGCDLSQGYWHARPMAARELTHWLSTASVQA